YLAWELLVLQERVRRIERRMERRLLRDDQNRFTLPHDEFLAHFRVSQQLLMDDVKVLRPHLQKQRITGLSPELQVLVAVNFYANGSYQKPVGNQCELLISQPPTNRCIRTATYLINQHLRFVR
ncbi:hypothetical protein EAI_17528, partial [Harpegnathos saltator]